MIYVDAMGDACPIPVVKTKNAIKEMNGAGGQVQTLVDNEISVQNLTKMAQQKGYGVVSEKLEENKYQVTMTIAAENAEATADEKDSPQTDVDADAAVCLPDQREKKTIVVFDTNIMGRGDDELGAALMKAFIYAVTQQDTLPSAMLFYNGGVKLTATDTPSIEDLKSLEAQGVEILSCGTCLNFYGLTEDLKVGSVTNMYEIVERMSAADHIIKP